MTPVQARAGAAHVQALKMLRMKAAAEAGRAPAPHEENVLTHWVRSAADMRLKVCTSQADYKPLQGSRPPVLVLKSLVHAICYSSE